MQALGITKPLVELKLILAKTPRRLMAAIVSGMARSSDSSLQEGLVLMFVSNLSSIQKPKRAPSLRALSKF